LDVLNFTSAHLFQSCVEAAGCFPSLHTYLLRTWCQSCELLCNALANSSHMLYTLFEVFNE
jgi:hypothetical protein